MRLLRKFSLLLLSVLIMFVMQIPSLAFYYDEGKDGDTEATAYIIDSLEDFIMMKDRVNNGTESEGKYYRLESDLDYSRSSLQDNYEIGTTLEHPFKGHFDGNGKTIHIKNEIDYSTDMTVFGVELSLFKVIESSGIAIKNLNLAGNITIFPSRMCNAAGLVNLLNSGIIENCTFTGSVEVLFSLQDDSGSSSAAGLVYHVSSNGIIRNCTFSGTVRVNASDNGYASVCAGGIALSCAGVIENCKVLPGSIVSAKGYESYAGGIAGSFQSGNASNSRISGCTSDAGIEDALYKGGIIGRLYLAANEEEVIPDYLDVKVFDNTFTGAEYAIGWPEGNPSGKNPVHEFNGHKYKVFNESVSWHEAKSKCESLGGHLATITSKAESEFIQSFANEERSYWLGGTDEDSEGQWHWITGEAFTFTNWNAGEPNNFDGKEHFLEFNGGSGRGLWNDTTNVPLDYEGGRYYICEWESQDISIEVTALERGRPDDPLNYKTEETLDNDNLICRVMDNRFVDNKNNTLNEQAVSKISAQLYNKSGLTADGNTRLILRASASKPGTFTFSIPNELSRLGMTLENLSRDSVSPAKGITASYISERVYQSTAVLKAPDSYVNNNPRIHEYTFNVAVNFTANDSSSSTKNLTLILHPAPVLLIHDLFGKSETNFAWMQDHGVWRKLHNAGLKTYFFNYPNKDNAYSVNDSFSLFQKIAEIIVAYNSENIACSRVDIIGHGMGGLIARDFAARNHGSRFSSRSYWQGAIHRLITIATPHKGTPLINLALNLEETVSGKIQEKTFSIALGAVGSAVIDIAAVASGITGPFAPALIFAAKVAVGFAADQLASKISGWTNEQTQNYLRENISGIFDLAVDSNFMKNMSIGRFLPLDIPIHSIYGRIKSNMTWFTNILDASSEGIQNFSELINVDPTALSFIKSLFSNITVKAKDGIVLGNGIVLEGKDILKGENIIKILDVVNDFTDIAGSFYGSEGKTIVSTEDLNDYDLLVPAWSAFGDFMDNTNSYSAFPSDKLVPDNWKYSHNLICEQDDVGEKIAALLLGGPENFKTFTADNYHSNNFSNNFSSARNFNAFNNASADCAVSLKIETNYTGTLTLPENGSQNITIIATALDGVISSYLAFFTVTTDRGIKIIRANSNDGGRTFSAVVNFQGQDAGMMNISCFVIDEEGTQHIPNKDAQLVIEPSEKITALDFSSNIIFTNVSSEVGVTLLASTEDGMTFDVSSPLAGTVWRISDPKIAEFMPSGNILGLKEGITALTASYKNLTASISIDVGTRISSVPESGEPEISPDIKAPSITTNSLPNAQVSKPYSAQLRASGTAPITWTHSENLPEGLTLSASGLLSGTPSKSGKFSLTVTASNFAGKASKTFTLTVKPEEQPEPSVIAPSFITSFLPDGKVGTAYNELISASGTPPITLTMISGTLPEGINFSGGNISGIPTKAGNFILNIRASNSAGSVQRQFTLKINSASSGNNPDDNDSEAPLIITKSLPDGTAGKYYSASISTSGTQPITFTLTSGNLPEGIKFSDGHITGTTAETGTFTFTIRAENTAGHSEQEFTLKIHNSSGGGSPAPAPVPDEPSDPGQNPGDDITPDIVIMRTRTVSNLSQSVINSLSNDKNMIAAVLPQIRINKSDAYDFSDIEILSGVPSESVLVWNAFASGQDNSYAQFFDKEGAEIQKVPSGRVINITAYLDAGETYAPVITAIRQSQDKREESPNNSGGSGGGGGCNSCIGGIIISMLSVAVLRKN